MIRFGVIGTNKITERFIEAAKLCENFQLAAVYSRTKAKAVEFADKYGIEKVFCSLEELAEFKEVDAVYIASPNSLHASQAITMLNGKKHVLCEKTIASNSRELESMLKAARENGVIVLEAMRSVFDPGFKTLADNLEKLGTIRRVTFQYCQYSSRYDNFKKGIIENAFKPELSNGALMDIGVYCVHPLVKLFGRPKEIGANAVILENGIDGAGTITVNYGNMQGELIFSKITNSKLPSQIQGEKGCMLITELPDIREIKIIYNNGQEEQYLIDKYENNMYYEVEEFIRIIQQQEEIQKHNESSVMSLEIMDRARKIMGIVFPADCKEC